MSDADLLIAKIQDWKASHNLSPRDSAVMEMAMGVIEATERKKGDKEWDQRLKDWKKSEGKPMRINLRAITFWLYLTVVAALLSMMAFMDDPKPAHFHIILQPPHTSPYGDTIEIEPKSSLWVG